MIIWGFWMIYMLRKLKIFDINPVTQALVISMAAAAFVFIHQVRVSLLVARNERTAISNAVTTLVVGPRVCACVKSH